jgi:hypothetical protein
MNEMRASFPAVTATSFQWKTNSPPTFIGGLRKFSNRAGEAGLLCVEPELGLGALRIRFRFAFRALCRRLKGAEAADFVHDPLCLEFRFQALERPVDRFSFADNNFRHFVFSLSF